MDPDTVPPRLVRVVAVKAVGTDAIVTVRVVADPSLVARFGTPGSVEVGRLGWIQYTARREVRSARAVWADGWSLRLAEVTVGTGRSEAGTPGPDGAGPTGIMGGDHERRSDRTG